MRDPRARNLQLYPGNRSLLQYCQRIAILQTLQVYKNDEGEWDIKTDNDAFYQALYGGANFKI